MEQFFLKGVPTKFWTLTSTIKEDTDPQIITKLAYSQPDSDHLPQFHPRLSPASSPSPSNLGPLSPPTDESESEEAKKEREAKEERRCEALATAKLLASLGDNKHPEIETAHREDPSPWHDIRESQGEAIDAPELIKTHPPVSPPISSTIDVQGVDRPMTDHPPLRTTGRPSLELDTTSSARKNYASFSPIGTLNQREPYMERRSVSRQFYDPVQDRSEPAGQRSDFKQSSASQNGMMQGRSPESAQTTNSQPTLPPFSALDLGLERTQSRGSQRPSSTTFSTKSPISSRQDFPSPYSIRNSNQIYHSAYSGSSPASTQNMVSPRERYMQVAPGQSPAQYEGYIFRENAGQTPLTDSRTPSTQATFSPLSNDRSPITESKPFRNLSPPLNSAGPMGTVLFPCMHEDCADRPPFPTQYLLSWVNSKRIRVLTDLPKLVHIKMYINLIGHIIVQWVIVQDRTTASQILASNARMNWYDTNWYTIPQAMHVLSALIGTTNILGQTICKGKDNLHRDACWFGIDMSKCTTWTRAKMILNCGLYSHSE